MQMVKYVVYHSEEFDHPYSAFTLGVLVTFVSTVSELTNIYCTLSQKTITGVIGKFVAFTILVDIPEIYIKSRANFRIKKAVGANPLVIITEKERIIGFGEHN